MGTNRTFIIIEISIVAIGFLMLGNLIYNDYIAEDEFEYASLTTSTSYYESNSTFTAKIIQAWRIDSIRLEGCGYQTTGAAEYDNTISLTGCSEGQTIKTIMIEDGQEEMENLYKICPSGNVREKNHGIASDIYLSGVCER